MSLFTLTVPARHVGVEYRHGRFVGVLEAGRHPRRLGQRVVVLDLRESLLTVAPQEVPTSEGIAVKVSATVRWAVSDPVAFLERSGDPLATVYLATQVALRDALSGLAVEDVVTRRTVLPAQALTDAVAAAGDAVGIGVAEVVVRDVIVPAELRHAAMEVVAARSRGAAQLEAARAETAALRSLANGARLLDAHPALARLRLVQAAPHGSTLVLRLGADGPDAAGD
ncbi:slipin family protein [Oryzobacter telluris]|uniref:slipin family protein n=1 Tax=Oryzobacter telluris TaxID=3149179 RepID=UPI00370DC868